MLLLLWKNGTVTNYNNFDVTVICNKSSSGASRNLDITYTVKDNVITSCSGTYKVMSGDGNNYTEPCDFSKLMNGQYISKENLITSISGKDKINGTIPEGHSCTYAISNYN